jgi:hypothetical protein
VDLAAALSTGIGVRGGAMGNPYGITLDDASLRRSDLR